MRAFAAQLDNLPGCDESVVLRSNNQQRRQEIRAFGGGVARDEGAVMQRVHRNFHGMKLSCS